MLFEIIKPWPSLLLFRATGAEAFVVATLAMFWLFSMHSLLVSFEIVDGCEAYEACTVGYLTYVDSLMSCFMLSERAVRILYVQQDRIGTYFSSD